jgi:glyoxylate reductase
MTKPRIFVTRRIPQEGLEILKRCCQVEVSDYDGVIPRSLLLEKVKDTDGLLVLLTDMIDKKVIVAAGKKLRVISNYAVGYNNIDVVEATKRGIMVTNTPGVLTETTADLAWALLMCIGRRIVEGDKLVRVLKAVSLTANKNSFQDAIKVNKVTVIIPGVVSGITTRVNSLA